MTFHTFQSLLEVWTPTEIRWRRCLEDGGFGTLDFSWFPCRVGVGFLVGDLLGGWRLQAFFCAYLSA